jgi:hypothetical protein
MTSKIRHQESGSFLTIRNVWLEGKAVPIPRNPVSLYKNNINILLGLFLGKGTNMLLALLLALVLSHAVVLAYEEEGGGGHVLPPLARPDGFSLEDMARLMGQFTTSGNAGGINSPYYPKTPFQILFTTSTSGPPAMSIPCPNGGSGFLDSGSNIFIVPVGTWFFLPLFAVDDSPPVLGTFPVSRDAARGYFFGLQQYGGEDFIIIVDGHATPVGPEFLAGPVTTPPLFDGGGTHFIQLGAFLSPLSPGFHIINIQGGIAGSGVLPTYGLSCLDENFTYFVQVIP